MIFINEFLPNPAGSDAENEWVELWNGGEVKVDLNGWNLADGSGKSFNLSGTIGAGEHLLLPRAKTKLVLRNTDGKLLLYDAGGKLADEASFLGTSPEGKSFSRLGYESDVGGQLFTFSEPTPGAKNIVINHLPLTTNNYPLDSPLNPQIGLPQVFGMAVGTALALAALVMIVLERNENIKNLLFRRNEEIR